MSVVLVLRGKHHEFKELCKEETIKNLTKDNQGAKKI